MEGEIVLVPLDGSELSEAALGYAETVARATKRRLRLLRVIETEYEGLLSYRADFNAELMKGLAAASAGYLTGMCETLKARGLEVESAYTMGSPAEEILRAAQADDIAMVVMTSHGRNGLGRWALGSVADRVLRLGAKPTLIVRPEAPGVVAQALVIARILVPLDGSELALAALEPARELALGADAEVVLARVVPDLAATLDWGGEIVPELAEVEAEMRVAARSALVAAQNRLQGVRQGEPAVLQGPAADTLLEFARHAAVHLVVMATHGRGGLARLVLGNTAVRLVQSGLPVLAVHPGPSRAA